MAAKLDIIGQKFGRLLVIGESPIRSLSFKVKFNCICDCGKEVTVIGTNLKNSNTRSCGCLGTEVRTARLTTHGLSKRLDYQKNRDLVRVYGITLDQLSEIYTKQGSNCLICGISEEATGRLLSIDHCHITGKIRGLLCNLCNVGLGNFKDNTELLEKAINYLNEHKE